MVVNVVVDPLLQFSQFLIQHIQHTFYRFAGIALGLVATVLFLYSHALYRFQACQQVLQLPHFRLRRLPMGRLVLLTITGNQFRVGTVGLLPAQQRFAIRLDLQRVDYAHPISMLTQVLRQLLVIGAGRFHAGVSALRQYAIFAQPLNQSRMPCSRVVEHFPSNLALHQQGNVQLAFANINSNDLHRIPLFTLPLSHSLRASLFTQAQASDTVRTLSASWWRGLYLRIRLVALGMTQPSRYRFLRAPSEILSNFPVGRIGNDELWGYSRMILPLAHARIVDGFLRLPTLPGNTHTRLPNRRWHCA